MTEGPTIFTCPECNMPITRPLLPLPDDQRVCVTDGEPAVPVGFFGIVDEEYWTPLTGSPLVNLADLVGTKYHRDRGRHNGCCGRDGTDGPNLLCHNGHEVGMERSDCWMAHGAVLLVTAVPRSARPSDRWKKLVQSLRQFCRRFVPARKLDEPSGDADRNSRAPLTAPAAAHNQPDNAGPMPLSDWTSLPVVRDPRNAPGDFYVQSECCLLCGVPWDIAPELFGNDDDGCWVSRQPADHAEEQKMLEVMFNQEVFCIHYCGTDERIRTALTEGGNEGQIDPPASDT